MYLLTQAFHDSPKCVFIWLPMLKSNSEDIEEEDKKVLQLKHDFSVKSFKMRNNLSSLNTPKAIVYFFSLPGTKPRGFSLSYVPRPF